MGKCAREPFIPREHFNVYGLLQLDDEHLDLAGFLCFLPLKIERHTDDDQIDMLAVHDLLQLHEE